MWLEQCNDFTQYQITHEYFKYTYRLEWYLNWRENCFVSCFYNWYSLFNLTHIILIDSSLKIPASPWHYFLILQCTNIKSCLSEWTLNSIFEQAVSVHYSCSDPIGEKTATQISTIFKCTSGSLDHCHIQNRLNNIDFYLNLM